MGKYTPGPWFVDENNDIWRRDPKELYENGGGVAGDKPLACCYKGWFGEGQTGYPAAANAQLIAAAPDLLAALKAILPMAENGASKPGHEGFCGPEQSCDCECMYAAYDSERLYQARAAIRKAEGE